MISVPWTEPHVEAAHLSQVNCVSVWVEKSESCVGRATNEHAGDAIATVSSRVENLLTPKKD